MITGYRSTKTRRVHETGDPKGFRGLDGRLAAKRLDMLAAAPGINDIPPLASIGLHKLSGDRQGQWAISVNGPWRICFRLDKDGFFDVEICDYHKG